MNPTQKEIKKIPDQAITVCMINSFSKVDTVKEYCKQQSIHNSIILTCSQDPPFFYNMFDGKEVSSWQEFGVADFEISRFWMENYKNIDSLLTSVIELANQPLLNNDFLKFDFVSFFGRMYIDPVMEFDKFIKVYSPNIILAEKFSAPVKEIIEKIAARHCIKLERMN